MTSPDGGIRIPINESSDDKSQIQEYLIDYRGEGIQHVALGTGDIHATVEALRTKGVAFQETPDTYYEALGTRLPGHREDTARLARNRKEQLRSLANAAALFMNARPPQGSEDGGSEGESPFDPFFPFDVVRRRGANLDFARGLVDARVWTTFRR